MPVRGKYGKTASKFDRTDFLSNGKNSISSYNEMRNGCLFNSANNSFLSSYQKAGAGHLCGSRNGNSYVTTEVTHSSEFSPDAKTSQSGQRSSCSGDADNECSEEDSSVKRLQRSYKSGLSLSSKSVYLQGEAGAKEPRRLSSEKLIETSNQDSQIQLSTAALNFSSCEASVNPFRNSCPNFTSALGDERLENVQLDCGVNHPCSAASSASCSGLVPVGRTRGESGESCPVPKFTKGDIELPLIAMTSTAGSSEVCLESYFIPSERKNRRKHSVKIFFDTTTSQTETSSRETDFDHRFLQSDQHNVSANTRSEIKHEGKILDGDVGGLCRQDIAETDGLNLIRSGAAIATSTPIRNSQRVPDDAEIQMLTSLLSPKLSVASNDEENENAQTYGGLEREERGANDEDVEPIEERLNVLSLSTLINPLHYGFDLEEEHGTSRSILYTSRSSHSISMLDIDKNQVPFYLSGCPFWSNSYRRNRNYFNELLFICDQQNVSSWFPGRKLLFVIFNNMGFSVPYAYCILFISIIFTAIFVTCGWQAKCEDKHVMRWKFYAVTKKECTTSVRNAGF
ncbi:hypothetical protein AB6A40_009391 [Gnathostoma spinigerum]|uniref:Uncharacterized protein n=1 Tax=Gnathostoma spinigerum TaxID=75299 RepID=A0ABD6F0K2_9BILA